MLQRVKCIDTLLVIQAQKAFQKIEALRLQMLAKALVNVALLLFPVLHTFTSGQRRPTRHVGVIGRANELEDPHTLVDVRSAFQDGLALEHFSENATFAR